MKAETALVLAVVAGVVVWFLTREKRPVEPYVLPEFRREPLPPPELASPLAAGGPDFEPMMPIAIALNGG